MKMIDNKCLQINSYDSATPTWAYAVDRVYCPNLVWGARGRQSKVKDIENKENRQNVQM